jgi:serine/threonine protein kinase/ABC-type branched-subunit amino acid transport system substrate-binding protein
MFVSTNVRLMRPLASGGMGDVWLGFHQSLETEVCVKFVSGAMFSADPVEADARMFREAVASARVKHAHVVEVMDSGIAKGLGAFLILEKLTGRDLARVTAKGRTLKLSIIAEIVTQVGDALQSAHQAGVVHRDIKPANLFLCSDRNADVFVKVLDFGIAKFGDRQLTATGVPVGTPTYMSPEQAEAKKDLDSRSDLYSLALVVFRLLTGRAAFSRETLLTFGASAYLQLPQPSLFVKGVSALDAWFAKACAPDRNARYQDAQAFVRAFLEATADVSDDSATLLPTVEAEPAATSDAMLVKLRPGHPTDPTLVLAAPKAEIVRDTPWAPEGAAVKREDATGQSAKKTKLRSALVLASVALAAAGVVAISIKSARAPAVKQAVSTVAASPTSASSIASSHSPRPEASGSHSKLDPRPVLEFPVMLDQSGTWQKRGAALKEATELAESLLNQAGGVRGQGVHYTFIDDQGASSPNSAAFLGVLVAKALKADSPRLLIGPITSVQVALVHPFLVERDFLHLSATATGSVLRDLGSANGDHKFLRTAPSDVGQAEALVRLMFSKQNERHLCSTLAIVSAKDEWASGFARALEESLRKLGRTPLVSFEVAAGTQATYRDVHAGIVKSRPDCQVLLLDPKAASRYLLEGSRTLPKWLRTFGTDALATEDFIELGRGDRRDSALKTAADGVRGVRPNHGRADLPEYAAFLRALQTFRRARGEPSETVTDMFVSHQFDAAVLAALAVERAGPDAKGAALFQAIREMTQGGTAYGIPDLAELFAAVRRGEDVAYAGASGLLSIDENGETPGEFSEWRVENGKLVP